MSEQDTFPPRFCPAAIQPLAQLARDEGAPVPTTADFLACRCEAGPQRIRLELFGITFPITDMRAGAFICGRTIEELNG